MPIKIGTGSSAVDLSNLKVAGVEPTRIMVGTGSTAVEVWSASIYPLSGTWGPSSVVSFSYITWDSHTIAESGSYTLTHTITRASGSGGLTSRIAGPWGNSTGNSGSTSTVTTTRTLNAGDTISFQVGQSTSGTATGSWSVVKN